MMNWTYHPKVGVCVDTMCAGGVIAYPTEAVWGLGCNPFCESAVAKILELKSRPWQKGLILVAGDIRHVEILVDKLTPAQQDRVVETWPGHTTWVMKHHDLIPWWVSGDNDTVAVRVSAHPVVKALTELYGGPIVSTSANPAGMAPARDQTQARKYFNHSDVVFCPGNVGQRENPSTIKDVYTGNILR